MVALSLIVNVLVLFPVLIGLLSKSDRMAAVFGGDAPARRILTSIYLEIALLSAAMLVAPEATRLAFVPGLLSVQVVYKVITVPMLGLRHPVALSNLAIAGLHAATLWTVVGGQ